MKVYKFGGASVKSAKAVRNLLKILTANQEELFIVISAMDKTTNSFECLLNDFIRNNIFEDELNEIFLFHENIINDLFDDKKIMIKILNNIFEQIHEIIKNSDRDNYDKLYDSVVSFGEIISTTIISSFLNENGIKNTWLDAREIIITDDNFRAASVNYSLTRQKISAKLNKSKSNIFITQGFIGADNAGNTTTLGREGSDYTAAVIANLTESKSLTLWKDVAGIYNADPKLMPDAVRIDKISFREATELAYFGAKIIHPKTAKPLMEKNIELYIRSFNDIDAKGTIVGNFAAKIFPVTPIYIFNKNQTLITLSSKTFQFISESFYEKVFYIFEKHKTKINLIQNSALNLSLCFDFNANSFSALLLELKNNFETKYNNDLTLITIRHFTEKAINSIMENKNIIMQQRNRLNAFFLVEE